MATFDFLAGKPVAPQGYNPQALQGYAPAWNTGSPQGMDYGSVLAGGQAQPMSATHGLDFSSIGQWALNQPSASGGFAEALNGLGGQLPQPQVMPQGLPMGGGRAGGALGQVQQGKAGYIGNGTRTGLLGMVR